MASKILTNKNDIIAWLDKYAISDYSLIEDIEHGWVVNAYGVVDLSKKNLENIAVKFNIVNGDFIVSHNNLTSLQGSPKTVTEIFDCSSNKLTSLVGGPSLGMGAYFCEINSLTNLVGAPNMVRGHFMCSENKLTSLRGGPEVVKGNYFATENLIDTLEFFPKKVAIDVFIINNPGLGEVQNIKNFSQLYQIHLNQKNAIKEKAMLQKSLTIKKTNMKMAAKENFKL